MDFFWFFSLSLCALTGRWLLQVVFWVVHRGGEQWMEAVEARERGGCAVESGEEENYRFLSPLLSSPLAGKDSFWWARGWLLEVRRRMEG